MATTSQTQTQSQTQTAYVDPSQNPSSHLLLNPSDNPGMKLVSMKFDGNCYSDWKRSMLISLSAKNKVGFVDGSIEKLQNTHTGFKAWDRCNSMLISWLLGVLDLDIARSVLYFSTAREIWMNLEERYGQSSGTLLFSLQQSLHDLKLSQDNISSFFTKIKMLWDQLDSVNPIPICNCANCSCTITQKLMKSQEDRRLIEFLMKLNDGYEIIRGRILVMNPLPSIAHAYRLILQEENHKRMIHTQVSGGIEDTLAFAAQRRRFQENNSERFRQNIYHNSGKQGFGPQIDTRSRLNTYFCDHCKLPGHTVQRFYKLHGYPQNFKTDRERRVTAVVHQDNDDEYSLISQRQSHSLSNDNSENISFTPAQYQQILQLIGKEKPEDQILIVSQDNRKIAYTAGNFCFLASTGLKWILDSGATDHMCFDLDMFDELNILQGSLNVITIPNGKQVVITRSGTIKLNNDLILRIVLFVPDFKYNLISIPKLCKDHKCTIVFNDDQCVLQGLSIRPLLLGKFSNGLYFLEDTTSSNLKPPSSFVASASTNTTANKDSSPTIELAKLWHLRMGHLSVPMLKHVSSTLQHVSSILDCLCQIFPLTKQARHSFSDSTSMTSTAFQLLHLDVWGPYKESTSAAFVGYPTGTKGYKVLNLHDHTVSVSRDVVFFEKHFPFHFSESHTSHTPFFLPLITEPSPFSFDTVPDIFQYPASLDSSHNLSTHTTHDQFQLHDSSQSSQTDRSLRRSVRQSKTPAHFSDYIRTNSHLQYLAKPQTEHWCHLVSYAELPLCHHVFIATTESLVEPVTYNQASKYPKWVEAMNKELLALQVNKTWVLVDLPAGKKPIGCKWVYKIKLKADGSVERYKSRLVAKGYNQQWGIDYIETLSPVVKMTTIRCLLALAAHINWPLFQLDVNNAFLHGDLHEEVYMIVPEGLPNPYSKVCKLVKSLYGLKQASRQWFSKLVGELLDRGYYQSKNDYSLFIKHANDLITVVVVYVDIILTGSDSSAISELKLHLDQAFHIKDLGRLSYFLGIEVGYLPNGISLTQKKFTNELLQSSGITTFKKVVTHLLVNLKLAANEGEIFPGVTLYRCLVGKLNFLTNTRPNLAYTVQHLSQFLQQPRKPHYQALLHTLHYMSSTAGQGILLKVDEQLTLQDFSDSDWGACLDSRRSILGYVMLLGKSPISWKSKKQGIVYRSSSEAEYRSMSNAASEVTWLVRLLEELGVTNLKPVTLYCDNQSAIHIAKNPLIVKGQNTLR
ncbi:uncharacterized protein LOC141673233 [Apium graveolens]|uniref:uncharacterized protein LOC141673233 n=1 Tax=Apium graveolens TaxID=4045 RepID=UPI003D78BBE8